MKYALIVVMMAIFCANGWEAPKSAKSINNPISKMKDIPKMISMGNILYKPNCETCHGTKGQGDGLSARFLTKSPTDLTLPKYQEQTDGELYWKIQMGKSPMPAFKDVLSEKKIWLIVNYLRTLKEIK